MHLLHYLVNRDGHAGIEDALISLSQVSEILATQTHHKKVSDKEIAGVNDYEWRKHYKAVMSSGNSYNISADDFDKLKAALEAM